MEGRPPARRRDVLLPERLAGVGAEAYWVPAGVLDDDPGVKIGGHIFVGSKAPWDEIAGSAPKFDEGIPGPAVPASRPERR